ncbi:MAG: hypothetical protein QM809_11380 [Gordonia sp. (in: high G+C Gram-positive bacteria)]|uniref:hypothetical protein n=1 Tax=Gordonia sp. (in: high G+C Gram-positive bacteria) TaxID=84139 RepID=UPI0039E70B1D
MTARDDPDAWWHSLPMDRRAQIFRWVAGPDPVAVEVPGQLELLDPLSLPFSPKDFR